MILASASPRRLELLSQAGFRVTVHPTNIDESRLPGESPTDLVRRLAEDKAHAALRDFASNAFSHVTLAADTIVWTGDDVLGKPSDLEDAERMLRELSGKTHHVSTGVCLLVQDDDGSLRERSFVETTAVTFFELGDDEIRAYVATGEPMDKAGAYGIQNRARVFVSRIEGDYCNVVGLPVGRVIRELDALTPHKKDLPATLMSLASA
jgi:septum formation protein